MKIRAYYDNVFGAMAYLVTDQKETQSVVIDPCVPYETVLRSFPSMPKPVAILLTHGHFDHVRCLADWKEKTCAPVCIHSEDAKLLGDPFYNCSGVFFSEGETYPPAERLLRDGEKIVFGNETLTVMHTPGHTAGSCLYLGERNIFTGDTLFQGGGRGRCDLPSGSENDFQKSLSRIFALEGDYRLYPGGGI